MLDLLFPTEEAPGDAEAVQKQPPQQQKRSRAAEDEVASLTQIVRGFEFYHTLTLVSGAWQRRARQHVPRGLLTVLWTRRPRERGLRLFPLLHLQRRQWLAPALALLLFSSLCPRYLGRGATGNCSRSTWWGSRSSSGRQDTIFPLFST